MNWTGKEGLACIRRSRYSALLEASHLAVCVRVGIPGVCYLRESLQRKHLCQKATALATARRWPVEKAIFRSSRAVALLAPSLIPSRPIRRSDELRATRPSCSELSVQMSSARECSIETATDLPCARTEWDGNWTWRGRKSLPSGLRPLPNPRLQENVCAATEGGTESTSLRVYLINLTYYRFFYHKIPSYFFRDRVFRNVNPSAAIQSMNECLGPRDSALSDNCAMTQCIKYYPVFIIINSVSFWTRTHSSAAGPGRVITRAGFESGFSAQLRQVFFSPKTTTYCLLPALWPRALLHPIPSPAFAAFITTRDSVRQFIMVGALKGRRNQQNPGNRGELGTWWATA